MDIRLLRYFVAVADERNFTRAAEKLHIAQPPLSRQIQQFETEIGAPLFDRTARPLRLTAIGRLVYEQSRQVLGRMEDMRMMVRRAVVADKRRFVIGFVSPTIYERLPPLIREFRAAAPHVELSLVELLSLEQIAALKEGRIDIGFGRIRFEDDAVRRIILREEKLMAAIPASHPLAQTGNAISLRDVAAMPQIIYPHRPRPSYADQVIALFHDHGLEPEVAHETREVQIAMGLVAAEEGASIVPESVQKSQIDGVCYVPLAEHVTSPIILSHRINDHSPELAIMGLIIARMYAEWGYEVPEGITRLTERTAAPGA